MIQVKHNGKTIVLPSSYSEVTLEQFFALRNNTGDGIDVLAILTGLTRDYWAEQANTDQVLAMLGLISWVKNVPDFSLLLKPDKLKIDGKYYDLPDGLGLHTLDQQYCFEDMLTSNNGKQDTDLVPHCLSIYFQPIVDKGKFKRDRLPAIKEKIMQCKIEEAFPVAAFFLLKYKQYLQDRPRHLDIRQAAKKAGLELTDLKSTESLERYGLFRRVCIKILRLFYRPIITRFTSGYSTTKTKQTTEKN